MIELRDVYKGFGSQQVLEGVNLKVQAGEKLAVIGKSGSGKSVSMKLMTGLLQADKGEVFVEGENVTRFRPRQWNKLLRHFGVVFQGAALFDSITVLENVGIRLFEERSLPRNEIRERVAEALKGVGLEPGEVMDKYPSELSGGMQKRVGVARAIVQRPKYLFYDEPTTGLDPVNSALIDELIESLAVEPGRTSIIITHDLYMVREVASRVAMIHDKRLHFEGTSSSFFESEDPVVKAFLDRSLYSK